jgi:hypothetical protein
VADGLAVGVGSGVDAAVGVEATEAAFAPGCGLWLLAAAVHAPIPTRSTVITPSPIRNDRRWCGIRTFAEAAGAAVCVRRTGTHREPSHHHLPSALCCGDAPPPRWCSSILSLP